MKKKTIIIIITVTLLAALLATSIILVAERVNMKVTLKKQFAGRISEAAYSLSEYEKHGEDTMYRTAFMSLEWASAVALTIDNEDYREVSQRLTAVCDYFIVAPETLALFHGELKDILEDFGRHRSIDNLDIKLLILNNRISAFSVYSSDANIKLITSINDAADNDELLAHYDAGGLVIAEENRTHKLCGDKFSRLSV